MKIIDTILPSLIIVSRPVFIEKWALGQIVKMGPIRHQKCSTINNLKYF
jgi:hypothetical protein